MRLMTCFSRAGGATVCRSSRQAHAASSRCLFIAIVHGPNIVNGPIARELNMNSEHNAFGPGSRSNSSSGQAVRQALVNIGGAVPGSGDMATFGSPAKFTYCIAENEAANPWEPLLAGEISRAAGQCRSGCTSARRAAAGGQVEDAYPRKGGARRSPVFEVFIMNFVAMPSGSRDFNWCVCRH